MFVAHYIFLRQKQISTRARVKNLVFIFLSINFSAVLKQRNRKTLGFSHHDFVCLVARKQASLLFQISQELTLQKGARNESER